MSGLASHGRGGAGNMADSTNSPKLQPKDLETPTLKTSVVTTGRGGTGNMAKNTDPTETRARQDVDPVTRRPSTGATHVGRGGTGNVFNPKDAEAAKAAKAANASAIADDSSSIDKKPHAEAEKGLAAKGKDSILGLLGKK